MTSRHELLYIPVYASNHFPSNGVATDPMTVFFGFFVVLTHLNTDALYFHLNILFENYNKRI